VWRVKRKWLAAFFESNGQQWLISTNQLKMASQLMKAEKLLSIGLTWRSDYSEKLINGRNDWESNILKIVFSEGQISWKPVKVKCEEVIHDVPESILCDSDESYMSVLRNREEKIRSPVTSLREISELRKRRNSIPSLNETSLTRRLTDWLSMLKAEKWPREERNTEKA